MDAHALAAALADTPVEPGHGPLLDRLRQLSPGPWKLAAPERPFWLAAHTVHTADGTLVAGDAEGFRSELLARHGSPRGAWEAAAAAGYRLRETEGLEIHATRRTGGGPADFDLLALAVHQVVDIGTLAARHAPSSADDFIHPLMSDRHQASGPVGGPAYAIHGGRPCRHMAAFLDECRAVHRRYRDREYARMRDRVVERHSHGKVTTTPFLTLYPDWDPGEHYLVRWFQEWGVAGMGGHPEDFFVFDLRDHIYKGERRLIGTPQPQHWPDGVKIRGAEDMLPKDLVKATCRLDQAVGLEFYWYFTSIHGNQGDGDVIRGMCNAMGQGYISLSLAQAALLTAWVDAPYSF